MQTQNNTKKRKNNTSINEFAKYSNIGMQMLVIILGGVFGGIQLDKVTPMSFPIFTIIGTIIAVVFATYFAIKDFIK